MRTIRILVFVCLAYVTAALCFSCEVNSGQTPETEQPVAIATLTVSNNSSYDLAVNRNGTVFNLPSGNQISIESGDIYVIIQNKSYRFNLTEDLVITDDLVKFLLSSS